MRTLRAVITIATLCSSAACTSALVLNESSGTSREILAQDLYRRISILADDSMLGRIAGSSGLEKARRYILHEVIRLGLSPKAENGTFLQRVPVVATEMDSSSSIVYSQGRLKLWADYVPIILPYSRSRTIASATVIYGGVFRDTATYISAKDAEKRVVILSVPEQMSLGGLSQDVLFGPSHRFGKAIAVAIAGLDKLPASQRRPRRSISFARTDSTVVSPISLYISKTVAEKLAGGRLDSIAVGRLGASISARFDIRTRLLDVQNIAATVGPKRRPPKGYVIVTAHIDGQGTSATTEEDSINNSADDNASGVSALLELAEFLSERSDHLDWQFLFIWHDAEEMALSGSRWAVAHPVVPLDSVIMLFNLDMVGRGLTSAAAATISRSSDKVYLQLIQGPHVSRPIAAALDHIIRRSKVLEIDKSDDEGTFCRSDHAEYSEAGVPVAFLTTGQHAQYHRHTDEVQLIDVDALRLITAFTRDVLLAVNRLDLVSRQKTEAPRMCF